MSITISEKWLSRRWRGGEPPSVEIDYIVHGTTEETTARAALLSATPVTWAGLLRREPTLEQIGEETWEATVTYSGLETQEFGLVSVDFDIGSQSTKIMQSIATVGVYPAPGRTAPNFYGAINVTSNGVEGVEIEIPTCEWTETWRFEDGVILPSYRSTLYMVTGRVNSNPFRGFQPGEVLFRGASGRKTRTDAWEISYRFAASPNATNISVGDITGIEKKGWEYLWVLYEDDEDSNAKKLIKRPIAAYVEQVYPYANFSVLGIGT